MTNHYDKKFADRFIPWPNGSQFAHNQYLDGITFYKVSNIDNRIQNADQLLTQDIDKFADNLSHLYSDIAKPLVDIVLFAYKLGEAM
jgi:ATP-binding cassette subfamily D (ALD) protein 3